MATTTTTTTNLPDPFTFPLNEGTLISYKNENNEDIPGYFFGELGNPGIVLLQEWWGVTQQIKQMAGYIVSVTGFCVIIPDLYRGVCSLDVAEAHHQMEALNWDTAVGDIKASANYLKQNGSQKVGVSGFCMGGALTTICTVNLDEIDCGVVFYGIPGSDACDITTNTTPLQAHFGDLDTMAGFSDPESVNAFEEKLNQSSSTFEIFRYPECGHAFMNTLPEMIEKKKEMGLPHHPASILLAWERFFTFMRTNLSS